MFKAFKVEGNSRGKARALIISANCLANRENVALELKMPKKPHILAFNGTFTDSERAQGALGESLSPFTSLFDDSNDVKYALNLCDN